MPFPPTISADHHVLPSFDKSAGLRGVDLRVFDAAVDLPAGQRSALLNERCGNDPELRRAIETLLEADAQTDSLDEQPFAISE